jgi:hypothetical protein
MQEKYIEHRVVYSMTTIPSRIEFIGQTLQSIKNQSYKADKIYLNVVNNCNIPEWIIKDEEIFINYCDIDFGPITKLLPTIEKEDDPNTIIITFDDDVLYHTDLVKNLINWSNKYPDEAIGYNGWFIINVLEHGFYDNKFIGQNLDNLPKNVDVLEGYKGVLYKRKFFNKEIFDYSDAPKEAFYVDDVWISGHLKNNNIKRKVVPFLNKKMTYEEEWEIYWKVLNHSKINSLCYNEDKLNRNRITIKYSFFKNERTDVNKINNNMDHIKIFTDYYEKRTWGDNESKEYSGSSGPGSSLEFNSKYYIPFLKNFINENNIKNIVDLGCGDFRCGEHIYNDLSVKYFGYDAYDKVIENNKNNFNTNKFEFYHLDFLNNKEKLISADMCILKDVLQHWLMEEIYLFLDYLVENKKYKFILLCNCGDQVVDNPINNLRSRSLSANFFPLKKYNAKPLFYYNNKEISLISC